MNATTLRYGRLALVLGLALCARTASAAANFVELDHTTDAAQVSADHGMVYELKQNGNIWQHASDGWRQVNTGSGISQIQADQGILYALASDGVIWRRQFGGWQSISAAGCVQISAGGGRLHALWNTGEVDYLSPTGWVAIDNGTGTKAVATDRTTGRAYVLKVNGNIFRYQMTGMQWDLLDNGSGTRSLTADADQVFALKDNGNIWHYAGSWNRIDDGSGTKQLVAAGALLFVLKDNGNVWMNRAGQWQQVDNGTGTRQVDGIDGQLFILKDNGSLYQSTQDLNTLPVGAARATSFNTLFAGQE